jgi:hypothetical protein
MKLLIHKLVGHVKDPSMPSGYKMVRGYFRVYENTKNLQQVMFNKQKYGYYAYPKDYKYERKMKYNEVFTKEELKSYKAKKAKERAEKYAEGKKTKDNTRFTKLVYNLNKIQKMSQEDIGKLVGLSSSSVGSIIRDCESPATRGLDNNMGET